MPRTAVWVRAKAQRGRGDAGGVSMHASHLPPGRGRDFLAPPALALPPASGDAPTGEPSMHSAGDITRQELKGVHAPRGQRAQHYGKQASKTETCC